MGGGGERKKIREALFAAFCLTPCWLYFVVDLGWWLCSRSSQAAHSCGGPQAFLQSAAWDRALWGTGSALELATRSVTRRGQTCAIFIWMSLPFTWKHKLYPAVISFLHSALPARKKIIKIFQSSFWLNTAWKKSVGESQVRLCRTGPDDLEDPSNLFQGKSSQLIPEKHITVACHRLSYKLLSLTKSDCLGQEGFPPF